MVYLLAGEESHVQTQERPIRCRCPAAVRCAAKTAPLSVSGKNLIVTGVNAHIVSEAGVTNDGMVDAKGIPVVGNHLTGLGNLSIGYNIPI